MRRSLTPAMAVVGLVALAACSSNGDSDEPSYDYTPPADTAPNVDQADPAPKCDRLSKAQLRAIGDGTKRGVKVVTGYGVVLGQVVDGDIGFQAASYTAAAVRVSSSSGTSDTLLAIPSDFDAAGLLLAADDAARKHFTWGEFAEPGSDIAAVADAVAASPGASDALECLATS